MSEWSDPFNVFNSMKALVHVPLWRRIYQGSHEGPAFVALDPCGQCDLNCSWCNSKPALSEDQWDKPAIRTVIAKLQSWGTKAVCIGGGGEPCMCKEFEFLIKCLNEANIKIGLITNGTHIRAYLDVMHLVDWVGISVDAASAETYRAIKGKLAFEPVTSNIRQLIQVCRHVEYKFLICHENLHEIAQACQLAKNLGCHSFHCRPAQTPHWDDSGWMEYDDEQLQLIRTGSENARKLNTPDFTVACVTHKFDPTLKPIKRFKQCYAGLTQCVITPNLDVGLCVCRRGDPATILGNLRDNGNLKWLSDRHRDLVASYDVSKCPQCSQSHVNEIWERMVVRDDMGSDWL